MIGGLRAMRLMVKKKQLKTTGFTIVETMIVLAVTGVLFTSLVTSVSGRQNKVKFQQAINDVKSKIDQVINETQSGYFPGAANFQCTVSGSTITFPTAAEGGTPVAQGANKPCVFLGKVLQFGTGISSNPEKFSIYTLAGLNSFVYPTATDFSTSSPTVANLASINEQKLLQHGLSVERIVYGADQRVWSIGLVSYFGTDGDHLSGSQSTQVIPIIGTTQTDGATDVGTKLSPAIIKNSYDTARNPIGGVKICFKSGTTDKSGLITIGGSNGTSSVTLDIKNGDHCEL